MPIVARAGINERISAADSPFDKVRRRGILSSRWSEPPVGHALKNVLFVCTGNTCRSPMAEGLFRELVKDCGDYVVGSAGVAALSGQPPSQHTADILKEKGVDVSQFRSRPITPELYALHESNHVLCRERVTWASGISHPDAWMKPVRPGQEGDAAQTGETTGSAEALEVV